jgi:ABC-2 type transport system ATP-binding protein
LPGVKRFQLAPDGIFLAIQLDNQMGTAATQAFAFGAFVGGGEGEFIGQFQRGGGTVLLTTHYMDEAERLCDRIAIIDQGLMIASGTPAELIEHLGGHHMVEFDATDNVPGELEAWRSLPGVEAVHEEDGRVVLSVREPHETIPALLAAIHNRNGHLLHLTTRQASLEDVFVELTGKKVDEE